MAAEKRSSLLESTEKVSLGETDPDSRVCNGNFFTWRLWYQQAKMDLGRMMDEF
jgi:hypothetical protein